MKNAASALTVLNSSVWTPTPDHLVDLLGALPNMKRAEVCVMTEDALCRMVHMADPFEALFDLQDRGVRRVICIRERSLAIITEQIVCEIPSATRLSPEVDLELILQSVDRDWDNAVVDVCRRLVADRHSVWTTGLWGAVAVMVFAATVVCIVAMHP
jgi:hypothetical protein